MPDVFVVDVTVQMDFTSSFFTFRQKSEVGRPGPKVTQPEDVMHLAVVACGNRLDETLTMVKSALLFSIKKIKFHIFAEEDLAEQFQNGVRGDPKIFYHYCSIC